MTRARRAAEAPGLRHDEIAALYVRLSEADSPLDLSGASTIRDVAEAAGLPEADVEAHLRRIRAEGSFAEPRATRSAVLPWIAVGALAVGTGVTWWRLHPNDPADAMLQEPASGPVPTPVVRAPEASMPLTFVINGPGGAQAPPGFHVSVAGQRAEQQRDGDFGEIRALPYETVRHQIVAAAEEGIGQLSALESGESAPVGTRYRTSTGDPFSPRKGFVRVSVSGWAGSESDWIAVPLDDVGRARLHDLATKCLAEAKATQEAALAPVADPDAGLVEPPPGFAVRFAGRRLDQRQGPRVSFAPIPVAAVEARLAAALLNAIRRDGRPPVGPWSGDAVRDRAIPASALGHMEIVAPDGTYTVAEVPTRSDAPVVTERAARALAHQAARGIERINGRALGTNGDPKP